MSLDIIACSTKRVSISSGSRCGSYFILALAFFPINTLPPPLRIATTAAAVLGKYLLSLSPRHRANNEMELVALYF